MTADQERERALAGITEALERLGPVVNLLDGLPTRLVARASLALEDAQTALEDMRVELRALEKAR